MGLKVVSRNAEAYALSVKMVDELGVVFDEISQSNKESNCKTIKHIG